MARIYPSGCLEELGNITRCFPAFSSIEAICGAVGLNAQISSSIPWVIRCSASVRHPRLHFGLDSRNNPKAIPPKIISVCWSLFDIYVSPFQFKLTVHLHPKGLRRCPMQAQQARHSHRSRSARWPGRCHKFRYGCVPQRRVSCCR